MTDSQRVGTHTLLVLIRLTAIAVLFSLLFLGPSDGGHQLTLRLPLDLPIDFFFNLFFVSSCKCLQVPSDFTLLNMVIISFKW